jgi:serine/threonine protein kinase
MMTAEFLSPKKHKSCEDTFFPFLFSDNDSSSESKENLFNAILSGLPMFHSRCHIASKLYAPSVASRKFTDRYNILKVVGEGGFGTVYQCEEVASGDSNYAVKVMGLERLEYHERRTLTASIDREIEIMRLVTGHKNIINFYDAYYDDEGIAYSNAPPRRSIKIVMEYPLGTVCDLFDRIVQSNTKPDQVEYRGIFSQLVDAVKYLHSSNIMHRDIKPENVLLVANNRYMNSSSDENRFVVKLLDFGLAKKIRVGENSTRTLVGSKHYTAPEVELLRYSSNNTSGSYGFAADCWSLGAVLHVMFFGGFPTFIEPENVLGRNVCFPAKEQILALMSQDCHDLIKNLLSFSPSERLMTENIQTHPWFGDDSPVQYNMDSPTSSERYLRKRRSSECCQA